MGLNFYLAIDNTEKIHIGKSSGGWRFSWNIIQLLRLVVSLRIVPLVYADIESLLSFGRAYTLFKCDEYDHLVFNDASYSAKYPFTQYVWPYATITVKEATLQHKWLYHTAQRYNHTHLVMLPEELFCQDTLFWWIANSKGAIVDENDKVYTLEEFKTIVNENKKGWNMLEYAQQSNHCNLSSLYIEYIMKDGTRCNPSADFD